MKKKIFTAIMAIVASANCVPAMAADFNVKAYDVSVPEKLRVPFENSKEGYFENGLVTGFGSAVTFKGYNDKGQMQFYAITDRGPNADAPKYKDGDKITDSKIFPCPDFTPSIAVLTVTDSGVVAESEIKLKYSEGKNITGLPLEPGSVGSTGETALDMNMNNIGYDNDGLDTEGIAVDSDGNFWICDEYGPFIVKADANGNILEKYAPGDGLPDVLKYRIPNRGFEGLTITPSGKVIASVQSVLDVNGETKKTACFTRFVELDPKTKETKMFAYPVDVTMYKSPKDCKIGDIYAVDDNTLLVIEQGKKADKNMSNVIYKVDISSATDISDIKYEGKELEYASADELSNINFAKKTPYIDLRANGWTAEKAEGICMTDDKTIAVINDNDFGITTVVDDTANDADITDYVYDSEKKEYSLNDNKADVKISIDENTEPAQLWLFSEKKSTGKYIMLRAAAEKAGNTEKAFNVDFDSEKRTVNIKTGENYEYSDGYKADEYVNEVGKASDWSVEINGKAVDLALYNVNGYNYVDEEALNKVLS